MHRQLVYATVLLFAVPLFSQVNSIEAVVKKQDQAKDSQTEPKNDTKTSLADTSDCARVKAALEAEGEESDATKLPLSYFGIGIGAINNIGEDDWVSDAQLVNKKVTIIEDQNLVAGPVLEAHALIFTRKHLWALPADDGRYFVTDSKPPCQAAVEFPLIAHGPFVMLRVGDTEIVKSVGAGWMMGFRMQQKNTSLNVGVAYSFELNAKTLAKGFAEGTEHADGTTILYRTTRGSALALVISFGF